MTPFIYLQVQVSLLISKPTWQSYSEQHSTWVISHGLSFVQLTADGQSHTGPTGYWYLKDAGFILTRATM